MATVIYEDLTELSGSSAFRKTSRASPPLTPERNALTCQVISILRLAWLLKTL